MSVRFVTETALCLAVAAVATATCAYADDSYVPYYYANGLANTHQYASVTPVGQPAQQGSAPAGVTVLSPPANAAAHEGPALSPLFHFNNEIWASAGASELNYKESVSPIPDSDRGELPSFAAGIDFMSQKNLYLSLDGSVATGNAHYNGALQNDTTFVETPYQTSTQENIANVDAKVGQGVPLSEETMLIPYVDLGYRYWDRDVGGGQSEDYQNFDALGGMKFEYTPIERLILSVYGSAGTTFGSSMKTEGNTYHLGGSGMEKVGGKIGYDVTQRVELFTTIDYDHFHNVVSPWVVISPTTESREPSSRTEDTTMRVGIAYHFR